MKKQNLKIWLDQPADVETNDHNRGWYRALPIGNGRIGGMVFGGVQKERIQLNEESIWAGPPVPTDRVGAWKTIEIARQLIFDGEFVEAEKIIQKHVLGERISPRSYQTLGDLRLNFLNVDPIENYRRELDLDTAIATVTFRQKNINFKREAFASFPDQILVLRLTADRSEAISLDVELDRPVSATVETDRDHRIVMSGQAEHDGKHLGVKFTALLHAEIDGGTLIADDQKLQIRNSDHVTFYLASETDYNFDNPDQPHNDDLLLKCENQINNAKNRSYDGIRSEHVADHQRLFRRVDFDLGKSENSDLPTDLRLQKFADGENDPDLIALYFQFGRYLLIASSRPDCMPANLQGIWNDHLEAPWNSDYHININLQMNYWHAQVTNLAECHLPFFDLIERLRSSGEKTARDVYNCRGFTAHHTTDAWLHTSTFGNAQYGMWPMAIGWCSRQFVEYYRFTGDRDFLRDRAFPILRSASEFFLDWLVEDPKSGKLVSGPTVSPENCFRTPSGDRACLSMGTSMDQQIIWETFTNCLSTIEILNLKDDPTDPIRSALAKCIDIDLVAETQIGSDGRLMEWAEEFDEPEPEPGHRHISHLYAIHPSDQYTFDRDQEKVAAARRSIEYRLAHGGGHTGWSRAWMINLWARIKDAENAGENVRLLLARSTLPNLFDNHPPFQIDGNFGGTAGIAEMLIQSHADQIELLPALPENWQNGEIKGLVARGGFEIDFRWRDGELDQVEVRSKIGNLCRLRYGDYVTEFQTAADQIYRFDGKLRDL